MKKISQLMTVVFIGILTFKSIESRAQYGSLKTEKGWLLFYSSSSGSLNFTLRLDEPTSQTPTWIAQDYLQLFKNQMHIQVIDKKKINNNNNNNITVDDNLYLLQKWETDYIEREMDPSIKRSTFVNDNNSIEFKFNNLNYNAWYYCVELNQAKLYLYCFDIYKNGYYIRITYKGHLDNARLFIPAVLKGLQFYNKTIDTNKLQTAAKNGQYGYSE